MPLPVIDYDRVERLSVPSAKPMELGNMISFGLMVLCVLYLFFRRSRKKTSVSS